MAAIGLPAVAETNRAGDVDALLAEADDAFAGRPDPVQVVRAQELFMAAARADDRRVEGLLGAMRATAWLVEHEADGGRREALVLEGSSSASGAAGGLPAEVECDYRLALALGQQARERPATAHDGLERMVVLLERAAVSMPDLDGAGPDRVLALVRLRAPGWPAGPGDPEQARTTRKGRWKKPSAGRAVQPPRAGRGPGRERRAWAGACRLPMGTRAGNGEKCGRRSRCPRVDP